MTVASRRFLLVRHGETVENVTKTVQGHRFGTLNDLGRSQAKLLGQALDGKKLAAASIAVADLAGHLSDVGPIPDGLGDAVGRAATVLLETLVEHREERLLMGGTANLTRNTADFGGSLRSVLEALEEQVVVLRLLAAQQVLQAQR